MTSQKQQIQCAAGGSWFTFWNRWDLVKLKASHHNMGESAEQDLTSYSWHQLSTCVPRKPFIDPNGVS